MAPKSCGLFRDALFRKLSILTLFIILVQLTASSIAGRLVPHFFRT